MYGDQVNITEELTRVLFSSPVPKMRVPHIYPSSASASFHHPRYKEDMVIGGCLRQSYLRFMGEIPSDRDTPLGPGSAEVGSVLEDAVKNWMLRAGIFLADQIPVSIPEYNVSGRADFMVKKGNNICGVEMKSKEGYHGMMTVMKEDNEGNYRPAFDHMAQGMVYLWYFRDVIPKSYNFVINKWIFLYVLRDNGSMAQHDLLLGADGYPIIENQKYPNGARIPLFGIQHIRDRWETLNNYISSKTVPPRDYELIYTKEKLKNMASQNRMTKLQCASVEKGQFAKAVHSWNKEKLGDKPCQWCEFKSKCWGLNGNPPESFSV